MTKVEVDLLTDQENGAVLRLPERKFPGVLIQGDTLHSFVAIVEEAEAALLRQDLPEARSLIREARERLGELASRYEDALMRHAIPLPY
jgi:DNA-directed RNA polymerase specialized sigma54-like protein